MIKCFKCNKQIFDKKNKIDIYGDDERRKTGFICDDCFSRQEDEGLDGREQLTAKETRVYKMLDCLVDELDDVGARKVLVKYAKIFSINDK